MRRRALLVVAVVGLAVIAGSTLTYAQDVTIVNIPFKFTVGKTVLQPGKYELMLSDDPIPALSLTPERGAATLTPYITRLAVPDPAIAEPKFVFDKVGEEYVLSEIWFPDRDGFLLHDTRQPHTHKAIKGAKKGTP